MLRSFIGAGCLRHWLARPGCPQPIRECKVYFDKYLAQSQPDKNTLQDVDKTSSTLLHPTPNDLRFFVSDQRVVLKARFKHCGVMFSRSSTHMGNSLILFYPHGDKTSGVLPGCVKYIFQQDRHTYFAVQRHLPLPPDISDPFKKYCHFPAKLYSAQLDSSIEIVQVKWVVSHFARWSLSPHHVVVLSLHRVCFLY